MLKRWFWFGVVVGILVAMSFAGGNTAKASTPFTLRVGETLTYKIYYGAIPAGTQTMKVIEKTEYQGKEVYRIRMEMATASAVAMLYTYKETEEILLDAKGFYPVYATRSVKKKNKNMEQETKFLYDKKEIVRKTIRNGVEEVKVFSVDRPCQNALSLYYYLRTRPWEKGKKDLLLFTKDGVESFSFTAKAVDAHKTALGTFATDCVENPELNYTLWFSKDAKSLPLQVEVKDKFDSRLIQED